MIKILAKTMISKDFEPFGDVIDTHGDPDQIINQGFCGRYHDKARLEFTDGRAGVSLFRAMPRSFPYRLEMMERHPKGSQTFIPMHQEEYLVTVAKDLGGMPDTPRAFIVRPGQAINFLANTWHGVLTPLSEPGLFAVVDRIGEGTNLDEYKFKTPFEIGRI